MWQRELRGAHSNFPRPGTKESQQVETDLRRCPPSPFLFFSEFSASSPAWITLGFFPVAFADRIQACGSVLAEQKLSGGLVVFIPLSVLLDAPALEIRISCVMLPHLPPSALARGGSTALPGSYFHSCGDGTELGGVCCLFIQRADDFESGEAPAAIPSSLSYLSLCLGKLVAAGLQPV